MEVTLPISDSGEGKEQVCVAEGCQNIVRSDVCQVPEVGTEGKRGNGPMTQLVLTP